MIKNKQLQRIITLLVEGSFNEGKMAENQVLKSIKILKSLSASVSIQALSEYLKALKRKMREHTIYIESAIPLSSVQVEKIKKIIVKKSLPAGRQAKITKVLVNVNAEILGGFKLRVGDEVWDESVVGKLTQVKEAIANG